MVSVKRCARERWFFLNLLVTRALIGILLNIINSINIYYFLISLSVHRISPDVEFLCTPLKVSI